VALEPFADDWQRAVCVVAHPDDLEYGASVAVARWTEEGRTVVYVLATSGEAGIDHLSPDECRRVRQREERAAAAAVGVDVVEFLDHPDGVVCYGLPLRRDLARAIRRHRPDFVLTANFSVTWGPGPGGPANQADHRNVGLAALDASRDAGNRWVFPELLNEGLEPWGGTRWLAVFGSSTPTHYASVEPRHLEAGVASLEAHEVYLSGLGQEFDSRAFLTEQIRQSGASALQELAVSFEVFTL
jgi:LmbE family N-acetylglucosaminyl deacetylase